MGTKCLVILGRLRSQLGTEQRIPDPYGKLNEVLMDILSRTDFIPLWEDTTFSTVEQYSTGTCAVNVASGAVTGTGTTITAAMVGRKFKFDDDTAWYTISARADDTHFTITPVYAGSANMSGEAFKIYQDEYSLASDFDGLSSRPRDLNRDVQLDVRSRLYTDGLLCVAADSGVPEVCAFSGVDSSGYYKVRLTPHPITVRVYHYHYRKKRTVYSAWDNELDTPPEWDDMVLAGLKAKTLGTPQDTQNYEMYFRRFNADQEKSTVTRHIRTGMRQDQAVIGRPRYHGTVKGPSY